MFSYQRWLSAFIPCFIPTFPIPSYLPLPLRRPFSACFPILRTHPDIVPFLIFSLAFHYRLAQPSSHRSDPFPITPTPRSVPVLLVIISFGISFPFPSRLRNHAAFLVARPQYKYPCTTWSSAFGLSYSLPHARAPSESRPNSEVSPD